MTGEERFAQMDQKIHRLEQAVAQLTVASVTQFSVPGHTEALFGLGQPPVDRGVEELSAILNEHPVEGE
jgi:hypothetical protein